VQAELNVSRFLKMAEGIGLVLRSSDRHDNAFGGFTAVPSVYPDSFPDSYPPTQRTCLSYGVILHQKSWRGTMNDWSSYEHESPQIYPLAYDLCFPANSEYVTTRWQHHDKNSQRQVGSNGASLLLSFWMNGGSSGL
jgi:hypothetical protein